MTTICRSALFLLAFFLHLAAAQAQNLNVGFGKNRVQYHKQQEEWQYYETAHFITYWYGDARNIAVTALQLAEYDYSDIQRLLEYQLTEKVELLVFSDLTDLKQSNIGADELFSIKRGETKVSGNKVFVYYDGQHEHLRRSVREGMAGIIINAMLFGSNLQEIVQNSVFLNLPGWYTEGLKAYCGEDWSVEHDAALRTLLDGSKKPKFNKLAKTEPILMGHAFWHYIDLHFGKGSISNLLYLTRINRGLDAGFRYLMGNGYERTTETILEYFQKRYAADANVGTPTEMGTKIKVANKRKLPLYQAKISPDGKRIAWVKNDIGKWKVYQQDVATGKRKLLLKGGHRNALQATDYAYPLLAWSMDNKTLGILYEKRDVVKLCLLNTDTKEKETKPITTDFQRVHSIDFVNPVDLVFSATVRGYTDLYIYHSINRQSERLTQDFWDDLDASFVRMGDTRAILFASNRRLDTLAQERIDTVLSVGKMDLFLYNLDTRSPELIRITDTPLADERSPVAIDSAHFAWTTDATGVRNYAAGYLEDYTAYNMVSVFLKDGAEVKALNTKLPGEWPLEKALLFYAPVDTVMKNIDIKLVDSLKTYPFLKKRAVSWQQTNYYTSLSEIDAVPGRSFRLLQSFPQPDGRTAFHLVKADQFERREQAPAYTQYQRAVLKEKGITVVESHDLPQPQSPSSGQASRDTVPAGWLFQVPEHLRQPSPTTTAATEESDTEDDKQAQKESDWQWNTSVLSKKNKFVHAPKAGVHRFSPPGIVPYRLKFRTDFVTTDLNNDLLFDGLDSYVASPAGFRTPPPGILLKANFKELLENYVVEAGVRLPTTFNGAEYYMYLDDRKRRIDRRFALYRRTNVRTLENNGPSTVRPRQVRNNTFLGQYELRYPFDPFFSLRGTATIRQDRRLSLSSDSVSLETPNYDEQRASIRVSAVYDNTVDVDVNLKTGSRARFYVEVVKRFAFNTQPNVSLRFNEGIMTVLNLDARHYHRVDRYSVLAMRFAAATTFGSEKILYYLGGVDNWIIPRFDNTLPAPQGENFAYETLAAHLRGFKQNVRNGSSFALINTELRVPIFKYFSRKPVLGNFWRNFQVTGFFDAGTAWTGSSPYNGDNPINILYLQNPPTVYMTVNYFREPIVAGYGVGVRMQLFGVFLRADYAWGIETKTVQKPLFYLALGTDF